MANSFAHIELSTDDVRRARDFYKKIFSWKFRDLGPAMGHYVMVDVGDKGAGGGLTPKMMPSQPTGWLPYVEVKSVKATISAAEEAGAKIVVPYQEIGKMGAIGIFIDPTGATLGLWETAKPSKRLKTAAKKKQTTKKKSAKKR